MYTKQENVIAIQSQQWIANALITLMETEKYSEITVTQICRNAGLVRKTFYRNFQNKEDVLYFLLDQMFADFTMQFDTKQVAPNEMFLNYYNYWYQHRRFLKSLSENKLFHIANECIVVYIKTEYSLEQMPHLNVPVNLEGYVINYIAAGILSILEQWVINGFSESAETLAQLTSLLLIGTQT